MSSSPIANSPPHETDAQTVEVDPTYRRYVSLQISRGLEADDAAEKCQICRGTILDTHVVVSHSRCRSFWHSDCVLPYLKEFGKLCPLCRRQLHKPVRGDLYIADRGRIWSLTDTDQPRHRTIRRLVITGWERTRTWHFYIQHLTFGRPLEMLEAFMGFTEFFNKILRNMMCSRNYMGANLPRMQAFLLENLKDVFRHVRVANRAHVLPTPILLQAVNEFISVLTELITRTQETVSIEDRRTYMLRGYAQTSGFYDAAEAIFQGLLYAGFAYAVHRDHGTWPGLSEIMLEYSYTEHMFRLQSLLQFD